jgi:hypothetical protein
MEETVVIVIILPGFLFLLAMVVSVIVHPRGAFKEHRDGFCDQCGYNLSGNASGICPECGLRFK